MRARLLFGILVLLVLAPDLSHWSGYLGPMGAFWSRPQVQPVLPTIEEAQPVDAKALPASTSGQIKPPALVSVAVSTVPEVPAIAERDIRITVADMLNLRQGPSAQSAVLGRLANGTKVVVLEQRRGWLHVESEGGQRGWVSARFVDSP